REKKPVALIARKGADLAFIPWARNDREIELSRFDVGGVNRSDAAALDASLFTERGIYRPGDSIQLAAIVRARNWGGMLAGVPLEVALTNAKEEPAGVFPVKLNAEGFIELKMPTSETAPTGVWRIELRRPDDGKKKKHNEDEDEADTRHLGHILVRVEEFQPDRLNLAAKLEPAPQGAWLPPENLTAHAELQTLFGIAAADRRVTAKLHIAPGSPHFEQWPGWTFGVPKHEHFEAKEIDLGETKTDAEGRAKFTLALEGYSAPLLRVSVDLEAFEADGGRGVRGALGTLVSRQPYLIGWKTSDDLAFIPRDVPRSFEILAIGPDAKPIAAPGLERVLIETRNASVLTKQKNGTLSYVSRESEKEIETTDDALTAAATRVPLPVNRVGRFRYEWRDAVGNVLSTIRFNVVGAGESARNLERDSELEITLPDKVWKPGEQLEVSLRAPYAGAGLITIERERVLSAQWFKADSASSVQHITVPDGIEGGAYVSVAFVRALDSPEIFTSPLSSGVAPFKVTLERRQLAVSLDAPERARPGERVRIGFSTPRASRIVVWAVDEGIHRVTSYRAPQPLTQLIRKPALEVGTWQLLDLLLPEYSLLKSAKAFGGDGDEPPELKLGLNPFKRRRVAPVVYWSGIIESGPERREVFYDVPDYFAGRLNIMAAAVAPEAVGVAEKHTIVKGPFVLTPNAPFFAAPGDEFIASLTVANQLEGDAITDQIAVAAEPIGGLEIIESPKSPLTIAVGKEATVRFRVRAKNSLGNAELKFSASAGKERIEQSATMSVRPGVPRTAIVQTGWFRKDSHDVPMQRDFFAEFAKREAVVSTTPLGLARGL
ncbi:MAG: MG2 domain-containing protein, partial [Chthoniobacteraceae bacterium]